MAGWAQAGEGKSG